MNVDKAKGESISKILISKMVKNICSFLRHAGFYGKFIKYFSNIIISLTHMLVQDVQFKWTHVW